VSLVAQAEFLDFELDLEGPFPLSFDGQLERDLALGLRFQPSPSLAVKLEAHQYRGFLVEDRDLSIFSGAPLTATYGLLSVSTSF
jgi:hypothetical protein